jgi:hypothetical protein
LVAALLYAASPWAVIYSRKIWAQDLLPLFVLGYIGAALAAFVDGRRRFLILHLLLLAIIIQIHLSGLAFIPFTAILLIIFRKQVHRFEVGLGLLAAALTGLPFALWALNQPIANLSSFISNLSTRPAILDLDSFRLAWLVLCGFDIHSLAGPNAFRAYLDSVPNIDPLRWLWGAGALIGLGVAARRRQPADLILALWFIAPILFFVRHSTPVYPHYFIIMFPAGYMLLGLAAQTIWGFFAAQAQSDNTGTLRLSRLRGLLLALPIALSALAQAGVWLALLFFIGRNDTTGGFGTPLGELLQAAATAAATLHPQGFVSGGEVPEVLVVGRGDDPAVAEFPAVMAVLLPGVPHRFVNGAEAIVVPSAGAAVIVESADLWAWNWYTHCAACKLVETRARGIGVVYLWPAGSTRVGHVFPEPRRLANGVELLGWESAAGWSNRPGWVILWRVGYTPAASDYHFFNHAANGQADGVGFPSSAWRDGDLVLSYFDLRPAGPVRVGMYEYPAVINVPVLDEMGNPHSDGLTAQP